jgi:hypothetical protein
MSSLPLPPSRPGTWHQDVDNFVVNGPPARTEAVTARERRSGPRAHPSQIQTQGEAQRSRKRAPLCPAKRAGLCEMAASSSTGFGYADKLKRKKNVGGQLGATEFFDSVQDCEQKMKEVALLVSKLVMCKSPCIPHACPMSAITLHMAPRSPNREPRSWRSQERGSPPA